MTVRLHSERVLLRSMRTEEVDRMLEARRTGGTKVWGPALPPPRDKLLERVERSGEFADGVLDLAIEVGGDMIGEVQARYPVRFAPAGVFDLGIVIYDEADRGRGIGRESVALLTSFLFREEMAGRVQASTDVDNVAMRRALETLGYGFEGVMRGLMPEGDGSRRDYALYGMTRDDWENERERWTFHD